MCMQVIRLCSGLYIRRGGPTDSSYPDINIDLLCLDVEFNLSQYVEQGPCCDHGIVHAAVNIHTPPNKSEVARVDEVGNLLLDRDLRVPP